MSKYFVSFVTVIEGNNHFGNGVIDQRIRALSDVNIAPVAQTSASAISGSATPQGNLSAIGTLLSKSGFTQSFTEHGIIIGSVIS